MRVYFLSSRPCALKINGVYLGVTDGFERYCELSSRDGALCEFVPLSGRHAPISFLFDDELLHTPPRGACVCLLPQGAAIYAYDFLPFFSPLMLIAHKKCPAGDVTVFSQGGVQAQISHESEEKSIALSEDFSDCEILDGEKILVFAGRLALLAMADGEIFFHGKVKDFSFDGKELHAETPLYDLCARTLSCVWSYDEENKKIALRSCRCAQGKELPEKFLLCELLQELRFGAEISGFLSPALAGAEKNLREYFGNYVKAIPLPGAECGAGIVCRKREGIYEMKYFAAEVKNGRIENIKRIY